jgi:membrane protease YdiL (CAAX protease family)
MKSNKRFSIIACPRWMESCPLASLWYVVQLRAWIARVMDIAPNVNSSVNHTPDRISRAQFMRLSRWFALAMCLLAAILPLIFGQPGFWRALSFAGLFTWQTALGGIAGLITGVVVVILITHWRPLHVIGEHLAILVAWETFRTKDHIAPALMAALGEELLFRGALQPLVGLAPMAAIFGLLHATAVAHVILAGMLGLGLGWLYAWSGSLWPPITAHLALDLVTGLLLTRAFRMGASPAQGD